MAFRRVRRRYGARPLWRRLADYGLAALILFLLMVLAVRLEGPGRPPSQGVAVVNDGDSITLGGTRIRLRGIDAPELMQTCMRGGKSYACGRAARESLRALIASRAVTCTGSEIDRYGRLLGDCRAAQHDLNAGQVAAGWAIAYGDYEAEEAEARRKKAGLWAGEFERPSEWRARKGHAPEPRHDFLAMVGDRARAWWSWLMEHMRRMT